MNIARCLTNKCKNCKNEVYCFKEGGNYIGDVNFKNAKNKNKRAESSKIQSKKKTGKNRRSIQITYQKNMKKNFQNI